MKVFILAGGFGSRISEYTKTLPKPMIEVGKKPILVHIMNIYLKWGYNDFYIATGYKSIVIKKFFKKFKKNNSKSKYFLDGKPCTITLLDTGVKTMTGGRLKFMKSYLNKDENFMFTYRDGISSINLKKLENFHRKKGNLVTVTAVRPPARFGEIIIKKDLVNSFKEKPQVKNGWINGGYFIAKKEFLSLIKKSSTILEKEPLEKASKKKQLNAFKHFGFWKCMDTKRDRDELDQLSKKGFFKKKLGI